MNNFIEYFYGIKVDRVIYNERYYSFKHNDFFYKLYVYNGNVDELKNIYEINKKLTSHTLMSEIVLNKNNEIVSIYNGNAFLLIKIFVNIYKDITLEEISFIANSLYKDNLSVNWGMLWSNKIDYLEDLINENGKKYPLIVNSFNYFVGMCENAISYFNNINFDSNIKYVISHKIIKYDDSVEILYNPLNVIFDYRVRDVAEYVKNSFFINNSNVFNELQFYLTTNNLSLVEVQLLISRLLYPSFYFEMYEDILIDNKEEKILLNIISRLDEYERYLNGVIAFLGQYYAVEGIDWLKHK